MDMPRSRTNTTGERTPRCCFAVTRRWGKDLRVNLYQQVDRQLSLLATHILAADFRGYDPYDVFDRLAALPDSLFVGLQRKAMTIANRIAPLPTRLLLRIKPQLNPKTLGLCLRSFALLHEEEGGGGLWRAATERTIALLAESRSQEYAMPVWGYPFDWR